MKKLGFGLMRLPLTDPADQRSIDMPLMKKMVDTFLERGFTYFDTAYMYHGHMSESAVREALVERHSRDSFVLTTKLPVMSLEKEGDQERIFEEQLAKCGVEYFDYYLLHSLGRHHMDVVERLGSFEFISRLKAEGKVKKIGFSFHDTADVLDRILTEHPEVDVVQLQINYLDWDNENVQSRLCHETAVRHGKQVIIMEPVKGGALAALPEEAAGILKAAAPDASLASWAVRFAAGLENVMVVLSGMSNMEQLLDNTEIMDAPRPIGESERKLLYKVADVVNNYTAVPCTSCRYCVEGCPMGIAIPDIFALYNRRKKAQLLRQWRDRSREEYAEFIKEHAGAAECIQCRRCEGVCPQRLEISELLKDAASALKMA